VGSKTVNTEMKRKVKEGKMLVEAGRIVGIELLNHLIVCE